MEEYRKYYDLLINYTLHSIMQENLHRQCVELDEKLKG